MRPCRGRLSMQCPKCVGDRIGIQCAIITQRLQIVCKTPADNIAVPPKFKAKSMMNIHEDRRSGSSAMRGQRASSTSNIYIDDSTVSKPNAKAMQKCLALAIYYHVKSNNHADDLSSNVPDIFDEQKHPLRKKKNQKPVDSQSDLVSSSSKL